MPDREWLTKQQLRLLVRAAGSATLLVLCSQAHAQTAQTHPLADASEVALEALHEHSKATFVGMVTSVDDSAIEKLPSSDPNAQASALTKVTFAIEQTISGAFSNKYIEIYTRGGTRRDGLIDSWSNVPLFSVGDRYLIAIKNGSYLISPFVNGFAGVLRIEQTGNESVLVDVDGNGVTLDAAGKLTRTKKISSSMRARRNLQLTEEARSASIDVSAHPDYRVPSQADLANITKADDVVAKLISVARSNRKPESSNPMLSKVTPEPMSTSGRATPPTAAQLAEPVGNSDSEPEDKGNAP